MKKLLSSLILLSALLVSSTKSAIAAPWVWKDNNSGRCVGQNINIDGKAYTDIATIQGFECLFYNILQVIVFFAGIAFFFMFITGGFKYLFSGGDSKKVAAASSTLTLAIAGVIGVIVSWFILNLISQFTGINVLDFIIPS